MRDKGDLAIFQNMASFRNMLVHHYEKIDDEVVFGLFKKRLSDFEHFITLIRTHQKYNGTPDLCYLAIKSSTFWTEYFT